MEFVQLHHPPDVAVLCDRKGCDQVADYFYLEVDDHGKEYRVCASHTESKTHALRLPMRNQQPSCASPFLANISKSFSKSSRLIRSNSLITSSNTVSRCAIFLSPAARHATLPAANEHVASRLAL